MRHERIIGMALVGLTLAGRMPAAGAGDLTLEAFPVSAGAVELRWNQAVDVMIERRAAGGAFEQVRRSGGKVGTYFDRGLAADTEYTYRFAVPTGWHYDFGPKSHPPVADHKRVDVTDIYSDEIGFGFERQGGSSGVAGRDPRPRDYTFVSGAANFIQRLPNGSYKISGSGPHIESLVINGSEVKTKELWSRSIRGIEDYPVKVTDGRLVVGVLKGSFACLNTMPAEGDPVKELATATVRTHSIAHMVGVMRDSKKPLADRLTALCSLGDMQAAAAPAAPAVAEILLETEQDKGAMHWVALWSLERIGPEHVSDLAQRAAAKKLLAGVDEDDPNMKLWLALAREIPSGIRQHRMGTLVIKTAPGAKVTVNQVEHEFWFGTAIANSIFNGKETEENRARYLSILKNNFNSAVHENAFKWYATEITKDVYTYETADAILEWCEKNGLRMRGHAIFWDVDKFVPAWQMKLDATELRAKVEQRAKDVMTRYKGRIAEYDVNNEMLHGRFYASRLGETIRHDMFNWCREADPNAVLYLNDYDILIGRAIGGYEKQISELLAAGVPVGGIGVQGHFGAGGVNPAQVAGNLDRLAKFNLPIKITEYDVKSKDEDIKARSLVDLYTVAFSHPAVDGILMWGFWEGAHWIPHAALWKRDWTPTKAAKAYRHLVYEKWWTKFEGTADEQGICEVPVFFGRHEVAVDGKPAQEIVIGKKDGKKAVDMTATRAE